MLINGQHIVINITTKKLKEQPWNTDLRGGHFTAKEGAVMYCKCAIDCSFINGFSYLNIARPTGVAVKHDYGAFDSARSLKPRLIS